DRLEGEELDERVAVVGVVALEMVVAEVVHVVGADVVAASDQRQERLQDEDAAADRGAGEVEVVEEGEVLEHRPSPSDRDSKVLPDRAPSRIPRPPAAAARTAASGRRFRRRNAREMAFSGRDRGFRAMRAAAATASLLEVEVELPLALGRAAQVEF